MDGLAKFIAALSGFAWPAAIVLVAWYFRSHLQSLFQLARQQIASGAAFKWRDFEFKGVELASIEQRDGQSYRREFADKEMHVRRHESYAKNKNLFLVHRVRLTGEMHPVVNLPTFDVSVYLLPHKNFGRINDVQRVEYYFGQHFGLKQSEYGTKYIVENGSDDFAVRVNAYGPMLCEARIVFHDGTETFVSRYLDFEGTNYRFNPTVNTADVVKIQRRQEA
jgi:hypothetical protein